LLSSLGGIPHILAHHKYFSTSWGKWLDEVARVIQKRLGAKAVGLEEQSPAGYLEPQEGLRTLSAGLSRASIERIITQHPAVFEKVKLLLLTAKAVWCTIIASLDGERRRI
jgi:hypothetical protein